MAKRHIHTNTACSVKQASKGIRSVRSVGTERAEYEHNGVPQGLAHTSAK